MSKVGFEQKIFCEYKDVLGRILANELPTHNYISFEFSHDSTDKDVVKFVDRVSWMLDVADSLPVTLLYFHIKSRISTYSSGLSAIKLLSRQRTLCLQGLGISTERV